MEECKSPCLCDVKRSALLPAGVMVWNVGRLVCRRAGGGQILLVLVRQRIIVSHLRSEGAPEKLAERCAVELCSLVSESKIKNVTYFEFVNRVS